MVKKLLFSFVLILMAAAWTTSEGRWVVGERKNASQIKAGDTVVMHMATRTEWADYYLKLADDEHPDLDLMISSGMGLGADAVVTFEEGPNYIRTESAKFISGQEELTEDAFAAYIAELKDMGFDELQGYYNDFYQMTISD